MKATRRKTDRTPAERAKSIARDLKSHLQAACGDLAHDTAGNPSMFRMEDDEVRKKLLKAKKAGVTDLAGWYADELFNDADFVRDILGDRLCDETYNDPALRALVLDELGRNAHGALAKAVAELRRD